MREWEPGTAYLPEDTLSTTRRRSSSPENTATVDACSFSDEQHSSEMSWVFQSMAAVLMVVEVGAIRSQWRRDLFPVGCVSPPRSHPSDRIKQYMVVGIREFSLCFGFSFFRRARPEEQQQRRWHATEVATWLVAAMIFFWN